MVQQRVEVVVEEIVDESYDEEISSSSGMMEMGNQNESGECEEKKIGRIDDRPMSAIKEESSC